MDVGYLVLHQMAHLNSNGLAKMLEAQVDKLYQMMEQLEVQVSMVWGRPPASRSPMRMRRS